MWAPAEPSALPSAKDIQDIKVAIERLETELEETLLGVELERVKGRTAALKKEILHRKAWIAPIRRLPFEIISAIFEFCAEDYWKTPVSIAVVSRQWRRFILAITCVWSFVVMDHDHELDLLPLYAKRCQPRRLHIDMTNVYSYALDPLGSIKDNIQCLSITQRHWSGILVFPNLTKIYLGSKVHDIELSFIGREALPALRHLGCRSFIHGGRGRNAIYDPEIALLETLVLPQFADITSFSIIHACRSTLVSLNIGYHAEHLIMPTTRHRITLPKLRCLWISGYRIKTEFWPLDLSTPALESYIESMFDVPTDIFIHKAISTVTHIHIKSTVPSQLAFCTNLQRIQIIEATKWLHQLLTYLSSDGSLCPALEVIECLMLWKERLDEEALSKILVQINSKRKTAIQVLSNHGRGQLLPAEPVQTCQIGSPCS